MKDEVAAARRSEIRWVVGTVAAYALVAIVLVVWAIRVGGGW
jgi:hypothetical protein